MAVADTRPVEYPDSDGEPMAENWLQAEVIRMLVHGFVRLMGGRPGVLVGGDNFWYPVKGENTIVTAPDVMVLVGVNDSADIRTMRSYRQWVHGGHPALVVEVTSPSNTMQEMNAKRAFYEQYGVDEYWLYDPDNGLLDVWVRDGDVLTPVVHASRGHVSPTTGVRVSIVGGQLCVCDPGSERRWLWLSQEAAIAADVQQRLAVALADLDAATAAADAAMARAAELEARLRAAGLDVE